MDITVWVLSTCLPPEGEPYVDVFSSEAAARAAFEEVMRDEWEHVQPEDDDGPLPYPGDPDEAHEIMDGYRCGIEKNDGLSEVWGRYKLTSHTIDVVLR